MFKYVKLDEIANEFASLKSQKRIIREATSVDHKLSIAFINNNKLKDKIKHFEIKARLQLLECHTMLHTYHPTLYTKRCSLCNHPNDTGSHILNGCTKLKSFYIERHNRIVDLIYKKLKPIAPNKTCHISRKKF